MATTSFRANVGIRAQETFSDPPVAIPLVTEAQNFVGAEGVTIFCLSTYAGVLTVNYIDLEGSASVLHEETIVADDLKVVNLSFRVPSFSVSFLPDAGASSDTITVEAYTY